MHQRLPSQPPRSLRIIADRYGLTDTQVAYARLAGVQDEAQLYSLLVSAPDIAEVAGFDTPDLTDRLVSSDALPAAIQATERFVGADRFAFGAMAPEGVAFREGAPALELSPDMVPTLAALDSGPLADEPPYFAPLCTPWPVRNQGDRGTCVAFATAGLLEFHRRDLQPGCGDLSEQFLYWAIKHHGLDSRPNKDGTWHEHAAEALMRYGICSEATWPYEPSPQVPISHHPPPAGAAAEARLGVPAPPGPQAHAYPPGTGKAATLLAALRAHGVVAIALPVFDSPNGTVHNWATRAAQTYGAVQNPLPGWVVNGGHAVLCVGFEPDSEELIGGHFIIRNSWGVSWGFGLPDPSYAAPSPGYGQVSASYVDRYLWETCLL